MVKFIITYSFVKLVSYKTFSGSKRQVMAFFANYPFLFSYPYRGECPGTFCFFARKTGLGKGKSLRFHFEEPIFRPKEVSIYSERRLCFSKMNKSFAQYLYMFSSITYIVLIWEWKQWSYFSGYSRRVIGWWLIKMWYFIGFCFCC